MVATDPIAAAPPELAFLIGSILLLSLRVWLGVTDVTADRRSTRVLNGLIFLFVAVFGVLVIVRFDTLA